MGTSVQTVINSALLRRLRLRHLELLTVLRDLPTVRGAARRLNLSQPAVSKMLREIEDVRGKLGLPAERDLYFKAEHRLSTYVKLACHAGMIVA